MNSSHSSTAREWINHLQSETERVYQQLEIMGDRCREALADSAATREQRLQAERERDEALAKASAWEQRAALAERERDEAGALATAEKQRAALAERERDEVGALAVAEKQRAALAERERDEARSHAEAEKQRAALAERERGEAGALAVAGEQRGALAEQVSELARTAISREEKHRARLARENNQAMEAAETEKRRRIATERRYEQAQTQSQSWQDKHSSAQARLTRMESALQLSVQRLHKLRRNWLVRPFVKAGDIGLMQDSMKIEKTNLENGFDDSKLLRQAFSIACGRLASLRKKPGFKWLLPGSQLADLEARGKGAGQAQAETKNAGQAYDLWLAATEECVAQLEKCRAHPLGKFFVRSRALRECKRLMQKARARHLEKQANAGKPAARDWTRVVREDFPDMKKAGQHSFVILAGNGQSAEGVPFLFDRAYYLSQNPDVAASGLDAFSHYREYGWKEGRSPHPLFDPERYLEQYPDIVATSQEPLQHYLDYGWKEGRNPHPLFDPKWYLEQYPDIVATSQEPFQHYLDYGWKEGRNPHPLFDGKSYLERYPEVAAQGLDPLRHYSEHGWRERRQPCPWLDLEPHSGENPGALAQGWLAFKRQAQPGSQEETPASAEAARHERIKGWIEPLFDAGYYALQNPDLLSSGVDLFSHYVEQGWKEGRNPHPLFDAYWYLWQHPDIVSTGQEPFSHYLEYGWKEGRNPHPLFDARWYLGQQPDVLSTGQEPFTHYLKYGWKEGRNPHPLFDPRWYLGQQPDVLSTGQEPFRHYVEWGWKEGRNPHPLFDARWYLGQHPDVLSTGQEPFRHYMEWGWKEGRNPHPLFDARWYLGQYPDIVSTGQEPFTHYLVYGWKEGRNPHPLFDARWYLGQYPDLASAGIDPFRHYVEWGWKEGRNPHPLFDVQWYLGRHPDLASAGVEPFSHYLEHGWKEGHNPHPLFNVQWYLEQHPHLKETNTEPLRHLALTAGEDAFQSIPASDRRHWALSERQYGDVPDLMPVPYTPTGRALFHGMSDNDFRNQLEGKDIVSFDIFDTALIRKVAHPSSVFDLLEARFQRQLGIKAHGFADLRFWAEREARKKAVEEGKSIEINLGAIYDVIGEALDLNDVETTELEQGELEEERRALTVNPKVLAWAKRAEEAGKRVIFVSDMYLPVSFLVEVLAAEGYASPEVHVSNEYGAGKGERKLFPLVAEKYRVEGSRILHVGDNLHSDKNCADAAGWRGAYYTENAQEQPYSLQLADTSGLPIGNAAVSAGIGLARVHRMRVEASGLDAEEKMARHIGYEILGPTILGFAAWIAAQARKDGMESVLFLARDGWLPFQAYEKLRQRQPSLSRARYAWASRRLLYCTVMRSEEDIAARLPDIHFTQTTTLADYLDILKLDDADILPYSEALGFSDIHQPIAPTGDYRDHPLVRERLAKLVKFLAPTVLQRAAEQTDLLRDYYRAAAGVEDADKIALVDLGWAGSLTGPLESIFKQINAEVKLGAYFFGLLPTAGTIIPSSIHHAAYFFYKKTWAQLPSPSSLPANDRPQDVISASPSLFEVLISANYTTVTGLQRDPEQGEIVPVHAGDSYSAAQRQFLETVHQACLKFVEDAMELLPEDFEQWNLAPLVAQAWKRLLVSPDEEEARILGAFPHRVDASGRTANTTVLNPAVPTENKEELWGQWRNSMWPNGWLAVLNPSLRAKMLSQPHGEDDSPARAG